MRSWSSSMRGWLLGALLLTTLGATVQGCSDGQRAIDDVRELVGLKDDDDRSASSMPALTLEGAPVVAPLTAIAFGESLDPADPREIELVWFDESGVEAGRSFPVSLTPLTFVAPVLIDPASAGTRRGQVRAQLRLDGLPVDVPGRLEVTALPPSPGGPGQVTLEILTELEALLQRRLLTARVELNPLLERMAMIATIEGRLRRIAALRTAVVAVQAGGTSDLGLIAGRSAILDAAGLRLVDDLMAGFLSAGSQTLAPPLVSPAVGAASVVSPALTTGEVLTTFHRTLSRSQTARTGAKIALMGGALIVVGVATTSTGAAIAAVGAGIFLGDFLHAVVARAFDEGINGVSQTTRPDHVGPLVPSAFEESVTQLSMRASTLSRDVRAGALGRIRYLARSARSLADRVKGDLSGLSDFLRAARNTEVPFQETADQLEAFARFPLPSIDVYPPVLVVRAGEAELFVIEVVGVHPSFNVPLRPDARLPELVNQSSVAFASNTTTTSASESSFVSVTVPSDAKPGTYDIALDAISALGSFDPPDVRVVVLDAASVSARFIDVSYTTREPQTDYNDNFTVTGDPADRSTYSVSATTVTLTNGIDTVTVTVPAGLSAGVDLPCSIRVTGSRRLDPDTNPTNNPALPAANARTDIFEESGRLRLFVTWGFYAYLPPGFVAAPSMGPFAPNHVIIPSSGGDAEIIVPR